MNAVWSASGITGGPNLMNVPPDAPEVIWAPAPERAAMSVIARFARWLTEEKRATLADPLDYQSLWRWSVEHTEEFWVAVWDFFGVKAHSPYRSVLDTAAMPGARWFQGVTLNYVEHVMLEDEPRRPALILLGEDGLEQVIDRADLRRQVAALAAALRGLGVNQGDRVAGYLPHGAHAIIGFLAAASLGAIWCQCGQDYAAPSAIDRLAQLDPVVLIAADGYRFNGRVFDRRAETARLRAGLRSVRHTIAVPYLGLEVDDSGPRDSSLLSWAQVSTEQAPLSVQPVPFDHPLCVLFSSGTTGLPKGIVHGHGGVLLEHLVLNGLHLDLGPQDTFLWHTTNNWMMWNVLVSGLLTGSTIVAYDGSPAYPDPGILWRLLERHRVTVFGTSPGHLQASEQAGLHPGTDLDLSALRIIGSTGATLPASAYRWVRDHVGPGILLNSLSGGTDVIGTFAASAPTTPVWAGELSARCLGVSAAAWDPAGRPLIDQVGELVVTYPMPSMPVRFWNDPAGTRYKSAYFGMYPGVWRHGDWVTVTGRGSVIMHGRSDSTLNRHGVRLGSAEIYDALQSVPQVLDSLIVGIDEPGGGYWMPLFVVLPGKAAVDSQLRDAIKKAIRNHASPRHVPDDVIAVAALPRTRTGKRLEVPVKRLLQGADPAAVVDPGAVDQPDALADFVRIGASRRAQKGIDLQTFLGRA
jgi:acetoacetyl-CoA synthetase